jgi:hypothetical protein
VNPLKRCEVGGPDDLAATEALAIEFRAARLEEAEHRPTARESGKFGKREVTIMTLNVCGSWLP